MRGIVTIGEGGGGGGAITPGDTESVVSFEGGMVGADYFGVLDFKCAAWDGDVCTMMQTRNSAIECSEYPGSDDWHTNVYANSSEERNCALICAATTGDPTWTECSAGIPNSDVRWAYSWSQVGTECSADKYLWRTAGVDNQCDPWCLNIAHGTNYAGSGDLRVSCAGW